MLMLWPDTEEQKEQFVNDPEAFDKYVRGLEGELNKRFTLVCRRSPFSLPLFYMP
jgi:hypothetical protein